eukprot:GEMP01024328.1.p1 GENE.GEMP01024328.1~~GEMP01024328.1.p1  ORF type:complete len:385 (+),score=76.33 GEMP01024328.1:71-1225(+)
MPFSVRWFSGTLEEIDVCSNDTAFVVRTRLAMKHNALVGRTRLLTGATMVKDDATVKEMRAMRNDVFVFISGHAILTAAGQYCSTTGNLLVQFPIEMDWDTWGSPVCVHGFWVFLAGNRGNDARVCKRNANTGEVDFELTFPNSTITSMVLTEVFLIVGFKRGEIRKHLLDGEFVEASSPLACPGGAISLCVNDKYLYTGDRGTCRRRLIACIAKPPDRKYHVGSMAIEAIVVSKYIVFCATRQDVRRFNIDGEFLNIVASSGSRALAILDGFLYMTDRIATIIPEPAGQGTDKSEGEENHRVDSDRPPPAKKSRSANPQSSEARDSVPGIMGQVVPGNAITSTISPCGLWWYLKEYHTLRKISIATAQEDTAFPIGGKTFALG